MLKRKDFWVGVILAMVVIAFFPQANLVGMIVGGIGGKGKGSNG